MKISIQFAMTLLAFASWSAISHAAEATTSAKTPTAAPAAAAPTLKMGDAAPEFTVTQWYKGGPVKLEADQTYIIECWATWCGPCIAAFPHLSEIAKTNAGKITVIGVNVWERKTPEEVKTFVEGQGDKMAYNVAADGDKIIENNWLEAAGQKSIPCAFIVNKGKIAWFGHPNSIKQEMIASILDGTFDVAAAAKAKEKEAAAGAYFMKHVRPLLMKKDTAGAITQLEAMKKEFPDENKTIDGHIERLKRELPKEPAPVATP